MRRDKEEFWTEMAIREISTQAHFAKIAFKNINIKASLDTDLVFTSVHSFLSHCSMISKLLCSQNDNKAFSIGDILKINNESLIHKRRFRNHLEHYDERLKKWINKYPLDVSIGTYNIFPKNMLKGNILFVSHYDPETHIFTFVDEEFNLKDLYDEVEEIQKNADKYIKNL